VTPLTTLTHPCTHQTPEPTEPNRTVHQPHLPHKVHVHTSACGQHSQVRGVPPVQAQVQDRYTCRYRCPSKFQPTPHSSSSAQPAFTGTRLPNPPSGFDRTSSIRSSTCTGTQLPPHPSSGPDRALPFARPHAHACKSCARLAAAAPRTCSSFARLCMGLCTTPHVP